LCMKALVQASVGDWVIRLRVRILFTQPSGAPVNRTRPQKRQDFLVESRPVGTKPAPTAGVWLRTDEECVPCPRLQVLFPVAAVATVLRTRDVLVLRIREGASPADRPHMDRTMRAAKGGESVVCLLEGDAFLDLGSEDDSPWIRLGAGDPEDV